MLMNLLIIEIIQELLRYLRYELKFILYKIILRIFLFKFLKNSGKAFPNTDLWIAFCAFHMGDYARAQQVKLFHVQTILNN